MMWLVCSKAPGKKWRSHDLEVILAKLDGDKIVLCNFCKREHVAKGIRG